jgi:hypothetical protein
MLNVGKFKKKKFRAGGVGREFLELIDYKGPPREIWWGD